MSALQHLGTLALIVAVPLAVLYLLCGPLVHRAPEVAADVSHLDARDGLTEGQPACHSPGPRGGHYVRAAGAWWVCEACGQTWARGDAPYDPTARERAEKEEK